MTSYEAVCDCCMETQYLESPELEVRDCPVCGRDLNADPHVHVEEEVDPRWAAVAARARAIACEKLSPNIPGFAVAVAVDGKIVWSEAFGYADLEAKRPATPGNRFSSSKNRLPRRASASGRTSATVVTPLPIGPSPT